MRPWKQDPGPCIVCGTAHCACAVDSGAIAIVQLPNRDAMPAPAAVPLVAEVVQQTLPPGQFTTATYRGKKSAP